MRGAMVDREGTSGQGASEWALLRLWGGGAAARRVGVALSGLCGVGAGGAPGDRAAYCAGAGLVSAREGAAT